MLNKPRSTQICKGSNSISHSHSHISAETFTPYAATLNRLLRTNAELKRLTRIFTFINLSAEHLTELLAARAAVREPGRQTPVGRCVPGSSRRDDSPNHPSANGTRTVGQTVPHPC